MGVGDPLGMSLSHALASGMGGIRTAGDLVARMQLRKMRLAEAKEYVAGKLKVGVGDLADSTVMRELRAELDIGVITAVPAAPRASTPGTRRRAAGRRDPLREQARRAGRPAVALAGGQEDGRRGGHDRRLYRDARQRPARAMREAPPVTREPVVAAPAAQGVDQYFEVGGARDRSQRQHTPWCLQKDQAD